MEVVDPRKIRLIPGQSIEAIFATETDHKTEVGIFVRTLSDPIPPNGDLGIEERAGVVKFDDLFLVLTMLRIQRPEEELFDVWWNYHASHGAEHFRRMSEQERLAIHFCGEGGREFSLNRKNTFRGFFKSLPGLMRKTRHWTDIEFDRAVRGFCAESYPKENLWEMIQTKPEIPVREGPITIDDYPGYVPDELRPYYTYVPGQGHLIRVIPSMLEAEAMAAEPDKYLLPAPVKTVLRCGVRWVKGYPVAPIPFIPGHGLAVPPDDAEL